MKELSIHEKAYDVLLALNSVIVKMWTEGYADENGSQENKTFQEIVRLNDEMNTIVQVLGSLDVFGWLE